MFLHCAPELPDQEIGCSAVQRRPKHRRQRRHGGGHIRKQRQKIHTPTEFPFNGSGGKNERGSTVAVSGAPWSLFSVKSIGKPLKQGLMQKTGHPPRYAMYQNWCPVWCGKQDLNLQVRTAHMNLNHARLPIPPFPQGVGRGGFEPPKSETADLQSAPFGHSGTYPYEVWFLHCPRRMELVKGLEPATC